jgi:hypothetical protein
MRRHVVVIALVLNLAGCAIAAPVRYSLSHAHALQGVGSVFGDNAALRVS